MNKAIITIKKTISLLMLISLLGAANMVSAYSQVTSAGAIAKGIDVSRYQGTIDWSKVAASGIKFAFIRIGNTYGGLDPTFIYNITQAQANGIKVGVYLYSYATSVEEATTEAALTIAWLNNFGLQLPVVYDVEDKCHKNMSTEALYNMINTYCCLIDAAGYYPMVYTYKNFYTGKLGTSPWDKWMAQYGACLDTNEKVAFWQYSSSGSVSGISGRVDMNYQYKDYSNLIINEGFISHLGNTRFYSGYKMQKGWIVYQNNRYYADALGNIQKGWFLDADAKMYYMDPSTGAMKTGLNAISGFNFYFDPSTGVLMTGFVDVGGAMKYFDPTVNGAMATSWFAYKDTMHYADANGNLAIGLTQIDKGQYYFNVDGSLLVNDSIVLNGKTYLADATGLLTEQIQIDLSKLDLTLIDPQTGLYHDPATGNWINPYTGVTVKDNEGNPINN